MTRTGVTMMDSDHDKDPFAVFTPDFGRFMVAESGSAAFGIGAAVVLLYATGKLSPTWLSATVAVGLLVVVIRATFMRRSYRIVIGDTWITGPTNGSAESTTIEFGTMDRARSTFRNGRLVIQSIGGREIAAKTTWYSPEDVEEMKRLMRDQLV